MVLDNFTSLLKGGPVPSEIQEVALSIITTSGSTTGIVLVALILVFTPLIYIAVLTKGPANDRLVKLITALRQRQPAKAQKQLQK